MIAERLTAQLLAGEPASDPSAVAGRLLAIQAQDPRGARLAIRARSTGLSAVDVERALTEERSLLITWLNRGTLHLVRSDDYAWLQALTTPRLGTGNARRLAQEGVTPTLAERGVEAIERSLADGPLTRSQLGERVASADVPTKGQALVQLLLLASIRGLVVRGPMRGRDHAFVLVRDWLGETPVVDRDVALAELARRYLAGHGPAADRDLAQWAGVPLRAARSGLAAIAAELVDLPGGLVDLARRVPAAELPPPRLLGPFDPLLHGWVSRDALLDGHGGVVTTNGIFRPVALIDGRVAGTWSLKAGKVELAPSRRLSRPESDALAADADDVVRYLGGASA